MVTYFDWGLTLSERIERAQQACIEPEGTAAGEGWVVVEPVEDAAHDINRMAGRTSNVQW